MSDIFKVNSASLSELCETLKVDRSTAKEIVSAAPTSPSELLQIANVDANVVEALSSRLSFDLAGATADATETAKDSKKFEELSGSTAVNTDCGPQKMWQVLTTMAADISSLKTELRSNQKKFDAFNDIGQRLISIYNSDFTDSSVSENCDLNGTKEVKVEKQEEDKSVSEPSLAALYKVHDAKVSDGKYTGGKMSPACNLPRSDAAGHNIHAAQRNQSTEQVVADHAPRFNDAAPQNNTHREQNDVALWLKKMSHLPKFDGKNWQAFINIFDKQMERHQLNDSVKLEILESKLIGSAFEFYGYSTTKVSSYDALRELMQNRFGSRITSQLRRTELLTIKQQAEENLVEFSSRVAFIAGEGYTDIPEKNRAELEVHAFLQGCVDHTLAERVMQSEHKDLNSALNGMIKATQNARVFNSSKSVRAVEMNNSNHSSTGIINSCNITDDNYEANLRKIITKVLKELNLGNPKHVRFENDSEHKESHHRDMRSRHYNDSPRLFNSAGKYRSPTRYETGYSDDRLPGRTDHRSMHSRSYNDRSRRAIGGSPSPARSDFGHADRYESRPKNYYERQRYSDDFPDRSNYKGRSSTQHEQGNSSRFRGNSGKIRALSKTGIHTDEHSGYDSSDVPDAKFVMTDYSPLGSEDEDQSLNE